MLINKYPIIEIDGAVEYFERRGYKFIRVRIKRKDGKLWDGRCPYVWLGCGFEKEEPESWMFPDYGEVAMRKDLDATAREEAKKKEEEQS